MTTREYAEAILVWRDPDIADVEDIIKAAVEEEREACAKIAEEKGEDGEWYIQIFADGVAEDIRARSNPAE